MDTPSIFLSLGLAFCVVGSVRAALNIRRGHQSERWPTTDGEVLDAFVRNWFGRHVPVVRYRYRVDGAEYRSSRVGFFTFAVPSRASGEAFIRGFRKGSSIAVRFQPDHPDRSVLRTGNRFANWVELVGGVLFGVFVAARIIEAWR